MGWSHGEKYLEMPVLDYISLEKWPQAPPSKPCCGCNTNVKIKEKGLGKSYLIIKLVYKKSNIDLAWSHGQKYQETPISDQISLINDPMSPPCTPRGRIIDLKIKVEGLNKS